MNADSTSTALSAVAVAQSAAAQIDAADAEKAARRAECLVSMKDYHHDGATVEQARAYASCVYTVYGRPEPLSAAAVIMLKIAVAVILICMAVGALAGWRKEREVSGSVLFALGGACVGLLLAMVGAGVVFVFS